MTGVQGTAAIIGGNGQLGSDLVVEFARRGYNAVSLTHADIAVDDAASVARVLSALKPSVVLNTAAFHIVPKCEDSPEQAFRVNALGALNVARAANAVGALNVYFSTDYVFDGAKMSPYVETDQPHPLNVYAVTKLAGEEFTLGYSDRGIVARVSGLYGAVPCRAKNGNFVTTMLKAAREKPEVRVVDDEVLTPTPTAVVAAAVAGIVEADACGVFHLTCEGDCSWYDFARAIFDEMKLATPLVRASVKDFPSPVRRPHYSVLEPLLGVHHHGANLPDPYSLAAESFAVLRKECRAGAAEFHRGRSQRNDRSGHKKCGDTDNQVEQSLDASARRVEAVVPEFQRERAAERAGLHPEVHHPEQVRRYSEVMKPGGKRTGQPNELVARKVRQRQHCVAHALDGVGRVYGRKWAEHGHAKYRGSCPGGIVVEHGDRHEPDQRTGLQFVDNEPPDPPRTKYHDRAAKEVQAVEDALDGSADEQRDREQEDPRSEHNGAPWLGQALRYDDEEVRTGYREGGADVSPELFRRCHSLGRVEPNRRAEKQPRKPGAQSTPAERVSAEYKEFQVDCKAERESECHGIARHEHGSGQPFRRSGVPSAWQYRGRTRLVVDEVEKWLLAGRP